jgi:hypothetical protein
MLTAGTFRYYSLLPSTLQLEHLDIPFYLLPSITSFYLAVMLTAGTLWISPFYLAVMLTAGTSWITTFYLAVMLTAGTFGCYYLLPSTLYHWNIWISLPSTFYHLFLRGCDADRWKTLDLSLLPDSDSGLDGTSWKTPFYLAVMLTAGTLYFKSPLSSTWQ